MTLRYAANFMEFIDKTKRADDPLVNIRLEYGSLKLKPWLCYSRVMLYSNNSKFNFDQSLVSISEPSEGINPVESAIRAAELLQNKGITATISGDSIEDFKETYHIK